MSGLNNPVQYDDVLTQILVNEKSILGFLSTIFNFLARRTDFYYVPDEPHENMGFPPGVAEELVVKVLRACDPKNCRNVNDCKQPEEINNEIMCSTVAQEVEVEAEDELDETNKVSSQNINTEHSYSATVPRSNYEDHSYSAQHSTQESSKITTLSTVINETVSKPAESTQVTNEGPPEIPTQKNSETYNGAQRETYSWAQTIMDLDVTMKLPPNVKSSKDLQVTINPGDICIQLRNGEVLVKDGLAYKIKTLDSFWSISEGKLCMHLEKVQERWWTKLLSKEEDIDLSKIDCSRQMDELPEDHVAKIRELQWNQEQKMKGLPTSDQLRNMEILKKAWNAEGSPFKGKEFDPSIFQNNSLH